MSVAGSTATGVSYPEINLPYTAVDDVVVQGSSGACDDSKGKVGGNSGQGRGVDLGGEHENMGYAGGTDENDTGEGTGTRTEAGATMMDLDALERLLGTGDFAESTANAAEAAAAQPTPAISDGDIGIGSQSLMGGFEGQERAGGNMGVEERSTEPFTMGETGKSNCGDRGAWELVEHWTPCAIGTLPGWSAGAPM